MQLLLLFLPPASPTYTPLGIASLAAWVKQSVALAQIIAVDLNARWHEYHLDKDLAGVSYKAFMRGASGDFFDKDQYTAHLSTAAQHNQTARLMVESCRRSIEQGECESASRRELDWLIDQAGVDCERIGLSVMYPDQIYVAVAFALRLRERFGTQAPECILGGAAMSSVDTAALLETCPWIDATFEGEGEAAIADLCLQKDLSSIAGLRLRQGLLLENTTPCLDSLKELPKPNFDTNMTLNPQPVLPVVYSRGCKWRQCRFCAHNFSFSSYRHKGVEQFVSELRELSITYGTRHFYFADQYIGAVELNLITRAILDAGLDIRWHVMARAEAKYTPELFQQLARAGCRWIAWGIESGSQRLLDLCRKGVTVSTIENLLYWSAQAGISNLAMMIFGLPTSGEGDLEQTMRFYERTKQWVDEWTASSFTLFAGTAFSQNPAAFGLVIKGAQPLFTRNATAVISTRLLFAHASDPATDGFERGREESLLWQRFRSWDPISCRFSNLSVEHYLLYADHFFRNGTVLA